MELAFFLWPFGVGFVLTALLCALHRLGGLYAAAVGFVLALGFAIWGYSTASADDDWGPDVAFLLAGYAYLFWIVGVGVAAGLVALFRGARAHNREA